MGARSVALLFIVFILFMPVGVGGLWKHSSGAHTSDIIDYLLLLFYGLYMGGLIVGFWREGLGGLISFGFMMIRIIIFAYYWNVPILFYVLFVPSLLYLLSWYFHRGYVRQKAQTGQ
jgi:CHASE2 domain-containing sensor protein